MNSVNRTPINGFIGAELFDLRASISGEDYRIFVAWPAGYVKGNIYPAVYVLDGNARFASAMDTTRSMWVDGSMPSAFVVGIGYPVDDARAAAQTPRDRDLTPPAAAAAGGAEFLTFIETELKPLMASQFPVDAADATLVGHSLGGLFATWALLVHRDVFQRYIMISPALWWDNRVAWQWAAARDNHATKPRANPVFFAAGALETGQLAKQRLTDIAADPEHPMAAAAAEELADGERHGWPGIAELTPEFSELLEGSPDLLIACDIAPDETHNSVFSGALTRGLRHVYGDQ